MTNQAQSDTSVIEPEVNETDVEQSRDDATVATKTASETTEEQNPFHAALDAAYASGFSGEDAFNEAQTQLKGTGKEAGTESEEEEESGEQADETADDATEAEADAGDDKPISDKKEKEEPEEGDEERKLSDRFRFKDTLDRQVASLKREHKDWSWSKCEAKARVILDLPPEDATTEETEDAKEADEATKEEAKPSKAAEIRAKLVELREARDEATANLDSEEMVKVNREIDALLDELPTVERQEAIDKENATTKAKADEDRVFEESLAEVSRLYPDAADESSDFFKAMEKLDNRLEAEGNPLFNDPEKPLKIAHMVNDLLPPKASKVESSTDKKPVSEQTTAKTSRRSATVNPVVSGSARSTPAGTVASQVAEDLDNASDPEKWASVREKFKLPSD